MATVGRMDFLLQSLVITIYRVGVEKEDKGDPGLRAGWVMQYPGWRLTGIKGRNGRLRKINRMRPEKR